MVRWRFPIPGALAAVVVAAALLAAGCTGRPFAERPSPKPSRTDPPSTIALAEVGDRLTVTASVDRVIADTAFVVRDVDLTDGTLLVLTTAGVPPAAPQLVTVQGTVIRFSYRELADGYRLAEQGPYRQFEGVKALAAERVTTWR